MRNYDNKECCFTLGNASGSVSEGPSPVVGGKTGYVHCIHLVHIMFFTLCPKPEKHCLCRGGTLIISCAAYNILQSCACSLFKKLNWHLML